MIVGGVVAAVAGGVLLGLALDQRAKLDDAKGAGVPVEDARSTLSRGRAYAITGDVLVVVGAASGLVGWLAFD